MKVKKKMNREKANLIINSCIDAGIFGVFIELDGTPTIYPTELGKKYARETYNYNGNDDNVIAFIINETKKDGDKQNFITHYHQ